MAASAIIGSGFGLTRALVVVERLPTVRELESFREVIRLVAIALTALLLALAIGAVVDAAPLPLVSPLESPLFYATGSQLPTATATPPVESAVAVVSGGQQATTLLPASGGWNGWPLLALAGGALLALVFLPRDNET